MSIIGLVIALLVIGFIIYIIQTAPIPINPWFKNIIVGVLVIGALIWLLQGFGVDTGLHFRVR
jgi:hypothetical protein